MSKRTRSDLFLLGHPPDTFGVSKLPSNREALGLFLKLHFEEKQTIREASTQVIRRAQTIWNAKARIPTKHEQDSIKKLENLFIRWKNLKKLRNRSTEAEVKKRSLFIEVLDDLFDIAHSEAMKMIDLKEDKDFLIAQREKGRRGTFGPIDTALAAKEERKEEDRLKERKRKIKHDDECKASTSKVFLSSSSDADSQMDSQDSDDEVIFNQTRTKCRIRGTKKIVTPTLAAVLDRTKVSDRKATMLITEAVKSSGENPASYSINRASIRRERIKVRENFVKNLDAKFSGDVRLTVHWDGKLMEDLTSKKTVYRLAILVSGQDKSQLLGVPSISSGTGKSQAHAVVDALQQWGITEKVVALCFDTTTSNTGIHGGSCVLIEELLERNLLYFPCRYHIMELILGAAFKASMPVASSGPEVQLFKRFQSSWSNIDKSVYESGMTNATVSSNVIDRKEQIVDFASNQLLKHQPRDDYRELLELTIIFLGAIPPHGLRFRAPGPMHHARWMSKAIYSIKVWIFRSQFKWTTREEKGLQSMCTFIALIYVEHWYTAPSAIEAPRRDLDLMMKLKQFRTLHPNISKAAVEKLQRHLWYLSEENVGLALFDDKVSLSTKRAILSKMEPAQADAHQSQVHKRCIQGSSIINENELALFASQISKRLFRSMGVPGSFLEIDPSRWNENLDFQSAREVMKGLCVVNDHAERGVALIQQYNKVLTKDEEQLQYLLQVVADHRRSFPDSRKSVLLQSHEY